MQARVGHRQEGDGARAQRRVRRLRHDGYGHAHASGYESKNREGGNEQRHYMLHGFQHGDSTQRAKASVTTMTDIPTRYTECMAARQRKSNKGRSFLFHVDMVLRFLNYPIYFVISLYVRHLE